MNQVGTIRDLLKEMLLEITEQNSERDFYNLRRFQVYIKAYYDQSHYNPVEYKNGDYVSVPNIDVTDGVNKKLLPKFKGPYIVRKVLPNDRYLISDLDDFQLTQRPSIGVFDAAHLKLWSDNEPKDVN